MKKPLVVTIAFMLLASAILIAIPTNAAEGLPDYECEMIDVGPRLRHSEVPLNLDVIPDLTGTGHHSDWQVGDLRLWLTLDDYFGEIWVDLYELRAIGTVAEVWVQYPRTLDDWWSFPPTTPPKPNPTNPPIVTQEQIDYILAEFETNIYPTDTGYFGMPDFHDGSDAVLDDILGLPPDYYYEPTGRNVIMVSNIRDEHYWTDYPYFIGGFYWGLYEDYFDRNIINIDCYDWEHRVGPEGTEWLPGIYVDRPYGYETTVAHEYQHLIHADCVPGDLTFINEGCSMFAEILCYGDLGISWDHINSYLYTPDNSLTEWGDQGGINILADYGAATLWAVYLNDRFGSSFWSNFMAAGIPGIDGLNALLTPYTFDEVYRDWRIANLIHTDTPGEGIYNYVTIDLGSPEAIRARTYDVKTPLVGPTAGTDFGSTITILGYDTGISRINAYGSDYIEFNNLNDPFEPILLFDGDDYVVTGTWIREDMDGDGDLEWYSTTGDLVDLSIVTEYTLPAGTVTLTIDTYYDIEDYWDFGFVQVSDDGGETWVSMANAYTTSLHDPSAHPDIVANLPGLTGWSGAWITMDFDLSTYAEETVLIRFRYMTDWAYGYPGWWIDDIKINGVLIDDADTTVVFGPLFPETDFMVTVIGVEYEKGIMPRYKLIEDITLDDLTETGMKYLDHFIEKKGCVLLIISPILGPTDYMFSVVAGE